jgi:hypothetical protein
MDQNILKSITPTSSYYFVIKPSYLKTEHHFSKNIKPNTSYRLNIFKGKQDNIQDYKNVISCSKASKPK